MTRDQTKDAGEVVKLQNPNCHNIVHLKGVILPTEIFTFKDMMFYPPALPFAVLFLPRKIQKNNCGENKKFKWINRYISSPRIGINFKTPQKQIEEYRGEGGSRAREPLRLNSNASKRCETCVRHTGRIEELLHSLRRNYIILGRFVIDYTRENNIFAIDIAIDFSRGTITFPIQGNYYENKKSYNVIHYQSIKDVLIQSDSYSDNPIDRIYMNTQILKKKFFA